MKYGIDYMSGGMGCDYVQDDVLLFKNRAERDKYLVLIGVLS